VDVDELPTIAAAVAGTPQRKFDDRSLPRKESVSEESLARMHAHTFTLTRLSGE
jgi:hypothetical protein